MVFKDVDQWPGQLSRNSEEFNLMGVLHFAVTAQLA